VDAMCGDNAPVEIAKGCVNAVNNHDGFDILLVGEEEVIRKNLSQYSYPEERILIRHASERIENEDVIALSALLEQANLSTDALELYYTQFEKDASSYFKIKISGDKELLENLWAKSNLRFPEKLKEIGLYISSGQGKKKLSNEEMVKLFRDIDMLREEIKK
jgi:hypothetical protein